MEKQMGTVSKYFHKKQRVPCGTLYRPRTPRSNDLILALYYFLSSFCQLSVHKITSVQLFDIIIDKYFYIE